MDLKFKQIIEQATKLAERAIPAFEAEQKLKELEPKFEELSSKVASMEKEAAAKSSEFRNKANKMADTLVTRGILDDSQKVAFVDAVVQDPKELIDVVVRLSSEVKAESFGKAAELRSSSRELDAFERLAME